MKKDVGETFCIIPWLQTVVGETGEFHVCTHARLESISDTGGECYNIKKKGDIELVRNSEQLKKLRREMLAGSRPKMCTPCFELEDCKIQSYRQRMNRKFEESISDLKSETASDGEVPLPFRYLHVRLGNFCNLKCRMCDPISSHRLMDELEPIYSEIDSVQRRLAHLKNPDWFKKKEAWDEIIKYLKYIDQIYLVGGEPFLIKESFEFLRVIIEAGFSQRITLHYNTNLTFLPKELYQLWPQFKAVYLHVSIDGYDSINHYIRYPTKWRDLDRNLHVLDEQKARLNCGEIGINTTVQIYNAFSLVDLFWYLKENFNNIIPYPNLEPVMFRSQLSLQVLTPELKDVVEIKLKTFISDYFKKYAQLPPQQFLNRIKQILAYMRAKDSSHLIPEFKKFTEHMDLARDQSVLDFVPELTALMSV